MKRENILKRNLLSILGEKGAHIDIETVLRGLSIKDLGTEIKGIPYTLWQLIEHIRSTQRDILEYIENPDYITPNWPEDYWPKSKKPPSTKAWNESIEGLRKDLRQLKSLIRRAKIDVLSPIPHVKKGPPYLREILLVIDHTAYHLGQFVLMRRLLGRWEN